jgi:hypothetical protein
MVRHGVGLSSLVGRALSALAEPVFRTSRDKGNVGHPRDMQGAIGWTFSLLFFVCSGIANAKVIGVTPGVTVNAEEVWHILNCSTPLPAGNYTLNVAPKYGSVTYGNLNAPPVGCPPTGPSLPSVVAYYTMNITDPPAKSDYFQLQYILNGAVARTFDIYIYNSNLIGKELGGRDYPGKATAGACNCDGQNIVGGPANLPDNTGFGGGQFGGNAASTAGRSGELSSVPDTRNPNRAYVSTGMAVSSGNVFYSVTDYATAGQNPLTFTRYYNSLGSLATQIPLPQSGAHLLRSTGSGANSTNSTPYGGAKEVRVASFASFLHIERLNSSS